MVSLSCNHWLLLYVWSPVADAIILKYVYIMYFIIWNKCGTATVNNIFLQEQITFSLNSSGLWPKKQKTSQYYLDFVHLRYISSLQLDPLGRNWKWRNQAQNKYKHPKERKKNSLWKEKSEKHEGLSKHLSAVFISTLRWIYYYHMRLQQPKGNGEFCSRAPVKKNPPDGFVGHLRVNTSRLVNAWVMSWPRGLVWWCQDIY